MGSSRSRKVDVRIIADTNRNLEEAVKAGAFRQDFFYRLNVFSIEAPPLRKRPADMQPLAERFLAREGLEPGNLSPQAWAHLVA